MRTVHVVLASLLCAPALAADVDSEALGRKLLRCSALFSVLADTGRLKNEERARSLSSKYDAAATQVTSSDFVASAKPAALGDLVADMKASRADLGPFVKTENEACLALAPVVGRQGPRN